MFVGVYAPAYLWAARYPDRNPLFIVSGLLGKIFGTLGFLWAVIFADFPAIFGLTILTNDLIWYASFVAYLKKAAKHRGGSVPLLRGD